MNSNFITVKDTSGNKFIINLQRIVSIVSSPNGTEVTTADGKTLYLSMDYASLIALIDR